MFMQMCECLEKLMTHVAHQAGKGGKSGQGGHRYNKSSAASNIKLTTKSPLKWPRQMSF